MTQALKLEVHRLSGGRMREVLNIIANIERIAATNGLNQVDVAQLEGTVLSYNWETCTPRTVRRSAKSTARAH